MEDKREVPHSTFGLLPKRLQSTIFQIETMKEKIIEIYEYKCCQDPFLRELFWEKVEKLRDLIDRNVQECYYNSGDCSKVLNFFICAFSSIMLDLRAELDNLVTSNMDGLIATNLRVAFKRSPVDYISTIHDMIEKSGAVNFIKTGKCLKSLRGKVAMLRHNSRGVLPAITCTAHEKGEDGAAEGQLPRRKKRRYEIPTRLPVI